MKPKKLKWSNLKKNLCPQCGKDFTKGLQSFFGVMRHECGFKIREVRMQQIVSSQITKDLEEQARKESEDL